MVKNAWISIQSEELTSPSYEETVGAWFGAGIGLRPHCLIKRPGLKVVLKPATSFGHESHPRAHGDLPPAERSGWSETLRGAAFRFPQLFETARPLVTEERKRVIPGKA